MPKKAGVTFLFFLALAVAACLSPIEGKRGVLDANGGWRNVRVALKKVFGEKRHLALVSIAADTDEQLAAADKSPSAPRHLAGDAGFSFQFVRTANSARTHLGDAAVTHAAFVLEGARAPRAVCRQIAIQTVYQPLAVAMPNLRSPPRATPEIS